LESGDKESQKGVSTGRNGKEVEGEGEMKERKARSEGQKGIGCGTRLGKEEKKRK